MPNGTKKFTNEQALAVLKQGSAVMYHSKEDGLTADANSVQLSHGAFCGILGLSKDAGRDAQKEYAAYVPGFGSQGQEVIFSTRALQKDAGILPGETQLAETQAEKLQQHSTEMIK